jgi:hypothetical protein
MLDERIEQTISDTRAKILILDPIQAYLGEKVDMHRANEVRPILSKLSNVAKRTNCAIILIGHLNKTDRKADYRGMGSIDFQAAARSVLTVCKSRDNRRAIGQCKNNLAPIGKTLSFDIVDGVFEWGEFSDLTVDELLQGGNSDDDNMPIDEAKTFILSALETADKKATEIYSLAKTHDISVRTLKRAKSALPQVKSKQKDGAWWWILDRNTSEITSENMSKNSAEIVQIAECQTS